MTSGPPTGSNLVWYGLTLVIAAGVTLQLFATGFYMFWFIAEGGPVESATFAVLLLAGIVALRARPPRPWHRVWARRLLGVILLVAAGEELSWGQRLLDYEPPAFFMTHNEQREFNLHNLVPSLAAAAVGYGVVVAFLLTPFLSGLERWLQGVGVPTPTRSDGAWVAGLLLLGVVVLPARKLEEIVEMLLAGAVLAALLAADRRSRDLARDR
jgi:hypothetical protein